MNRTNVLTLSLLVGQVAFAAETTTVAVFFDFETAPSVQSVSKMKTEVADIMRPSGLSFDWHSLADRQDQETFPELVVVRFQGSCEVRNPALDSELGPGFSGGALATTAISDGHILPFSSVRCDEIKRYLATELATANPSKRESLYGKALGRIVAHELYHILAATGQHGKEGVARAAHSRAELTESKFRFSAEETALLRDRKLKALLSGEAQRVGW